MTPCMSCGSPRREPAPASCKHPDSHVSPWEDAERAEQKICLQYKTTPPYHLEIYNEDGSSFLLLPDGGEPRGSLVDQYPEAIPALRAMSERVAEIMETFGQPRRLI